MRYIDGRSMNYIGTPLTTSAELTRTCSGSIRSIRFASTLRLLLLLLCGTPGGWSIADKVPGDLGNLRGLGKRTEGCREKWKGSREGEKLVPCTRMTRETMRPGDEYTRCEPWATCNRLEIYFAKGMANRDREFSKFTSSSISYRFLFQHNLWFSSSSSSLYLSISLSLLTEKLLCGSELGEFFDSSNTKVKALLRYAFVVSEYSRITQCLFKCSIRR